MKNIKASFLILLIGLVLSYFMAEAEGVAYITHTGKMIAYVSITACIISIVFMTVLLFRRVYMKWPYIISVAVLSFSFLAWGINVRSGGVQKVLYPLTEGEKAITGSQEIQAVLEVTLLDDSYKEISYDQANDPGMKNGSVWGYSQFVLNNGDIVSVVTDDEYMVVREGKKEKMYQKKF